MKKYLEHEEKVKFMDGVLEQSQEWQWFINLLEEIFDYPRCTTWDDFLRENHEMKDVLSYFIKIHNVCDKEFSICKPGFFEIWQIAKFYNGAMDYNECIDFMHSTFGKAMLFCIYITKLSNAAFGNDYIFDISVMYLANYYELKNFDEFSLHEEEVMRASKLVKDIPGFEIPYQIMKDNFSKTERKYCELFFVDNEKNLVNYNSINWHCVKSTQYCTWQEKYLLDMLNVSLEGDEISPVFVWGNKQTPDTTLWTKTVLERMKAYFSNQSASFVIETIQYFMDATEMSEQTKLMHLELLDYVFGSISDSEFFHSSSYLTVSRLMKRNELGECRKESVFLSLIEKTQAIEECFLIEKLRESGWFISSKQKKKLTDFYKIQYKKILTINSFEEVLEYVKDKSYASQIDNECFAELIEKFLNVIDTRDDIHVSSLFFSYMHFLFAINGENANINKKQLRKEMIKVQKLWHDVYYEKQMKHLKPIVTEGTLPNEQIDAFNKLVLLNPIVIAKNCFPCSNKDILQMMCRISENPMTVMFSRMTLNTIFPTESSIIDVERHDVDVLLCHQIKEILAEKGYKLRNAMKTEEFLRGIHEEYEHRVQITLSMFTKIEELYDVVLQSSTHEMIPFSDKLTLGMVTQLFPVLEERIRELAELLGFFPFKKEEKSFMVYNDPSSLMREIIIMVHDESKSFEPIPDFLFVYNMMYNSNSFNIRNECIHGRDYLSDGRLYFAFVATLLAIHMVNFRINTINENISDLIDLDEQ